MGDAASDDLSVGAERRYGEQIMQEVRRDPAYLDDPILLEYLNSLWQPLVATASRRGDVDLDAVSKFHWEVFLVQDRSVNAFALPGGFVGVHLGLIAMTSSRDELASVLAHELSHVTQRHIARSIASASRQTTIGMVAMILGMIAASRSGNADMASAAVAGSQAAMIQGQLNFSRDMEREADRIGYGVYRDSGFDPAGMGSMFDKLDRANRLNDAGGFPYLRSHPLTVDRLAEARARVPFASAQDAAGDVVHAMMQARAKVLMDQGVSELHRNLASSGPGGDTARNAGAVYAAVMSAALLKDLRRTRMLLDELTGLFGPDASNDTIRQVSMLRADSMLEFGDTAAAKSVLFAQAAEVSRPALILSARAALADHDQSVAETGTDAVPLRQVEQRLYAWVAQHRWDAATWALIAQAEDRLGNRLRSIRAQAEVRAASGDVNAAIDRLRTAQRQSRRAGGADLVDASVIDARLKELQEMQREALNPPKNHRDPGLRD